MFIDRHQELAANILNRLVENAGKVRDEWRQHPRYILFSANGFTDTLQQRSEKEGVALIETDGLF